VISDSTRPLLLPYLDCVLPLLKPLEDILPKQCLNLQNVCHLWELQERQALTHKAEKKAQLPYKADKKAQLLYFDKDTDNARHKSILFRDTKYTGACQVDKEKILEVHGKNAIATIPFSFQVVFNEVAATIDKACPYDQPQIDPATVKKSK